MRAISCTRCTKPIAPGAKFCRRCGARVQGVSPPRRRSGLRWVVGLFLLVLGILGMLLVLLSLREPEVSIPAEPVSPPWPAVERVPAQEPRAASGTLPPLAPLPPWRRTRPADLPPDRDVENWDYRGMMLSQRSFLPPPGVRPIFAGADLLQAQFRGADLRDADFRGADLSQANFIGADLARARFDEAKLHQTFLIGRDTASVAGKTWVRDGVTEPVPAPLVAARHVGQASFRYARISQVDMDGLNLSGANFQGAELSQVSFRGADLRGTNFRGSRHLGTDFARARIDGADLRGADLSSGGGLNKVQLSTALTDDTTRLPRW